MRLVPFTDSEGVLWLKEFSEEQWAQYMDAIDLQAARLLSGLEESCDDESPS